MDDVEFAAAATHGGDDDAQAQVRGELGEETVDDVGERGQVGGEAAHREWRYATVLRWCRRLVICVHRDCLPAFGSSAALYLPEHFGR